MSNKHKKYLLPLLLAARPAAYFKEGEGKGAREKTSLKISLQQQQKNSRSFMLELQQGHARPLPQPAAVPWHWSEVFPYTQRTEMSQELRMLSEQVELTLDLEAGHGSNARASLTREKPVPGRQPGPQRLSFHSWTRPPSSLFSFTGFSSQQEGSRMC